jgi:hypothetical protein
MQPTRQTYQDRNISQDLFWNFAASSRHANQRTQSDGRSRRSGVYSFFSWVMTFFLVETDSDLDLLDIILRRKEEREEEEMMYLSKKTSPIADAR